MSYIDRPSDGGTALLAVTVASAVVLAMLLIGSAVNGATLPQLLSAIPFFVLLGFPISFLVGLLVAAFIGLPLTYLLAKLRWERPWAYPLAGFIVGTAVATLILGEGDPLAPVLVGAAPGMAAGIVWWRHNRRHWQESGD